MLVRFALTNECYKSSPAVARRIAALWARAGVLYYTPGSLTDVPSATRSVWRRAFKVNRAVQMSEQELPVARATPSMAGVLARNIRLLGIDDGLCEAFSINSEAPARQLMDGALEAAWAQFLELSDAVEVARSLAESPVASGTAVEELWRSRFAPVLTNTRLLTVVDRYALKRAAETGPRSGLCRLLARLSEEPGPKYLKVFSQGDMTQPVAKMLGVLAPIRTEVFVVTGMGQKGAKDRWMQADRFAIEIGHGLEILEGERVQAMNTFSFKPVAAAHEETVMRLSRDAQRFCFGPAGSARSNPTGTITRS